ncbi:hypothetical protein J3458_002128 [Metarhizium acridum]|uniref:Family c-likeg-protein-coupled receptor protein n=1 Tax=Metarhizium acridum (strain CQMa 102) TaxID=655827 RepID=E9E965_METAQ|nr:uncharacterized protein MAC_06413 [Metarhizium acridum CQMa 102]EFY87569.1 hypothetical protein MAC_06413 [Metarhizium acridum CQMa 102]KAG8425427.1 hypothetical protein J3458_002128 [Metarhizium acridum]
MVPSNPRPHQATNNTKNHRRHHHHHYKIANPPPQGPPYPPRGASLGGTPTNSVDTPLSSVFIALFVASAALNMTIFQRNRRRGHKFVLSALLFGFSMARISANVMRIVWANYPHDVPVAIAATILANAGVLLLFVVNLVLSQRILRAHHPRTGWSRPASLAFVLLYAAVAALLVMVVVSTVYGFYTLDARARSQLRDIQLFAVTLLAVLAFLPVPVVALAVLLPRRGRPIDHFGKRGGMRSRVLLVLFTAALLAFAAGFRAGVAYVQRPASNPAWFHHKAAYYCVNYTIEAVVVFTYALSRFDLRFHVPNGASKPGHYSNRVEGEAGDAAADGERPRTETDEEEKDTREHTV